MTGHDVPTTAIERWVGDGFGVGQASRKVS